jgi:hypothetical protein
MNSKRGQIAVRRDLERFSNYGNIFTFNCHSSPLDGATRSPKVKDAGVAQKSAGNQTIFVAENEEIEAERRRRMASYDRVGPFRKVGAGFD